jgi:hypothetical protein
LIFDGFGSISHDLLHLLDGNLFLQLGQDLVSLLEALDDLLLNLGELYCGGL